MLEIINSNQKQFDLEDRSRKFAIKCRIFVKTISKTIANIDDGSQLIRSSGSIGVNYIEANEAISKKDFLFRIKICRKESKESVYWLTLIDTGDDLNLEEERNKLKQEATELMKIFSSIMRKSV